MTLLLKEDSGLTDFLRQTVGPDPTENKGKKNMNEVETAAKRLQEFTTVYALGRSL